jgi:pimeloyl-ACP methyl ester carboxylesterase
MPHDRPADQFTTVNGHRIRYWQVGESGSPIVLLHGIACSVTEWEKNIAALATRHRVFAVDILGYGLSDKPASGPFDIPGLTGFVLDFMTAVGLDRAHLVGNSMGARLALECAARAPERVASLVLSAPAGIHRTTLINFRLASVPVLGEILTRPSRFGIGMLWRIAYSDPRHVTPELIDEKLALAQMAGAGPSFMKTLRSFVGLGGFLADGVAGLQQRVRGIRTPALAIWGKQDGFLPVAHLDVLKGLMPHLETTVLDPCGHVPMLERPDDFDRLTLGLIDRHDTVTRAA